MEDTRRYGADRLAANAAEANSSFGQAVNYFDKHFDGLSAFCRHEGTPLDNNRMERGLKLPIRNRKNAMFFKSAAGAAIADVITSVIATCAFAGINPLIYLRSVMPAKPGKARRAGCRGPIKAIAVKTPKPPERTLQAGLA